LLDYDEKTGLFTRKINAGSRGKVGDIAGCKNPVSGYIQIRIDGKKKYLGLYIDKLSAAKARYAAELKYDWQKHETFTSSAKLYIDKYERLSMKIQKNIRKNILKNGYNNNSFQI